jgi:uncharacterized membrane protein YccC
MSMYPSWRPWLYSLRAFAAAMCALCIGFAIGLSHRYWAMATACVVSQPFSGATWSKSAFRLAGTLIGTNGAVILVPNLEYAPALLSLALAASIGGCLFLLLLDRTPRSYVFMLAGYFQAQAEQRLVNTTEVLDALDATLTRLVTLKAGSRRRDVLLGLVGACANLFPHSPPYHAPRMKIDFAPPFLAQVAPTLGFGAGPVR